MESAKSPPIIVKIFWTDDLENTDKDDNRVALTDVPTMRWRADSYRRLIAQISRSDSICRKHGGTSETTAEKEPIWNDKKRQTTQLSALRVDAAAWSGQEIVRCLGQTERGKKGAQPRTLLVSLEGSGELAAPCPRSQRPGSRLLLA